MESMVGITLSVIGIYLLLGLIFSVPFVLKGAARIDPAAQGGSWGFKLLIIPGVCVFWPLLAKRWFGGVNEPPEECSAQRNCAACPKGEAS